MPKRRSLENAGYNTWANSLAKKWGISRKELEQDDYDYKGFYKAYPFIANSILKGDQGQHFPDTYKLPTHPTFSSESIYSGINGNPVGGSWKETPNNIQRWNYILSPSQIKNNWNVRRTLDYAGLAEDQGFKVTDEQGRLPMINGVVEGGVLPNVEIKARKFKNGGRNNYLIGGGKKNTPITTGGAGYIPNLTVSPVDMLRQKIYKSISPDDSYNLGHFFIRLLSDNDVYKDYKDVFDSTDRFYPEDETNKAYRQSYDIADEMLATYLSIPKEDRHSSVRLKKSKYQDAYALPLHESMKKYIIDETNGLSIGKNKSVMLNGPIGLGYTAIGKGYDNKGEYRSYGDRYDLNPARGKLKSINIPFLESIGDVSMGIGKPFDIYDRIYLDDYYGVSEPTHSTYLPEVTVYGNKKKLVVVPFI